MPLDPNEFRKPTKETLAKRAGYICSNPNCRIITSRPHNDDSKAIILGEAAHIKGAKESARYDSSLAPEERRHINNGIWLCCTCHKLVDSDELKYTVEVLNDWKNCHEEWISKGEIDSPPKENDLPKHTATGTPSLYIHNLPFFNQAHHFGREEFLTQLHEIFKGVNTAELTQVITGLGGVGKTQIALAYAYIYKENYRYIWWVRAENPTTCDLDYQEFARRMELCGPEAERQEVITKVSDWQEKNEDWLFVYDNAMEYAALQDYLPRFPKGHILITTRNHHFEIGNPLSVDVFTREAAGDFLRFRTKLGERELSLTLGWELGGLPLALEQAAAYIIKNHLTLQTYLDLFRKYKLRLFSNTQPPTSYNYSVATTWQISLDQIAGEATKQLLYLSVFLDPDRISKQMFRDGVAALPRPLAEAVADEVIFDEMLNELEMFSLIRRNENELWTIHRLLQEVVRESQAQERADWVKNIMELLYEVYNFDYHQQKTWEKAGQLIPHMQAIAETIAQLQIKDERAYWIYNQIGKYLYFQGRYEEVELFYKRALEIGERLLGPNHPDMAKSLNNLAVIYYNRGRYKEAELLYKRALEIRERVLGPDHPGTANSLNNLAGLYNSQGCYAEAEPLYERALEIRNRALGPDHPETANSLNNLAGLYKNLGRFEEAGLLYKRALEIRNRALGPDHPYTANSLNNLADLYKSQGRYEEAELTLKQGLEIEERVLGPDHPDTASSLNNLADLYKRQGRYEEAESTLKRALEIRERVLGQDHPDTANSLNILALLYNSQGQYEEAESLNKRALETRERVLGPNHPFTATSLNNLAVLYHNQGRYEEAEPLYKSSLEIRERVLGSEHPDVANSLNNLAGFYNFQGRYEEAEPLYKRALGIWGRVLGSEHPDMANSLNNLAGLYYNQGHYEEAETLFKRAIEIRERVLRPDHPDMATSLNNLAGLYYCQGRYEEAEPFYKRALEIRELVLGSDHPDLANSLNNLALLYKSQDRFEEAGMFYKRALEILITKFGNEHPTTQICFKNLVAFMNHKNKPKQSGE